VIIQNFLAKAGEDFASFQASFSAQTLSRNLQDVFESKLEKKGKKLGAPAGKQFIFFIDDLNMPQPQEYGFVSYSCMTLMG
jgi:dynein heavy chain